MLVLIGLKICAVAVHGRDLSTTVNVLLGFRWFESMEQKPSYLGTKSDFYTHVHDLPPQLGGELVHSDCGQDKWTRLFMLLSSLAFCHWPSVTGLLSLAFCHWP